MISVECYGDVYLPAIDSSVCSPLAGKIYVKWAFSWHQSHNSSDASLSPRGEALLSVKSTQTSSTHLAALDLSQTLQFETSRPSKDAGAYREILCLGTGQEPFQRPGRERATLRPLARRRVGRHHTAPLRSSEIRETKALRGGSLGNTFGIGSSSGLN
jgi:hypothetical protein